MDGGLREGSSRIQRGGICHCDVYRPGAIRLEIEKKHVGQYGDALRVMHRGLNGRFSL